MVFRNLCILESSLGNGRVKKLTYFLLYIRKSDDKQIPRWDACTSFLKGQGPTLRLALLSGASSWPNLKAQKGKSILPLTPMQNDTS